MAPHPQQPGRPQNDPEESRAEAKMKCGHCKKDHDTVDEVRRCFRIEGSSATSQTGQPNRVGNPGRKIWDFPAGYYAVPGENGRPLDFYRIDKPEKGKWRGWTFIKMVIGGKSDASIRDHERIYRVLEAIQGNPERAAWLYGTEIGNCDKCNTHLTDATSRQHGRGPECRKKYGPGYMAASAA